MIEAFMIWLWSLYWLFSLFGCLHAHALSCPHSDIYLYATSTDVDFDSDRDCYIDAPAAGSRLHAHRHCHVRKQGVRQCAPVCAET